MGDFPPWFIRCLGGKMKKSELEIRTFPIDTITIAELPILTSGCLTITQAPPAEVDWLEKFTVKIISPTERHQQINTVMDVLPISTKALGEIGYGITHTLTGVKVVLTGAIKNGEQLHEFGSSAGFLDEQMVFGKAGTPNDADQIILLDILVKEGTVFDRKLCLNVFSYADQWLQPIREQLKKLEMKQAKERHFFKASDASGKPKVILVKQVAGQGAMYDNLLFPKEPGGFANGVSIIDIGNMPILLTPNEYRDGAIRAMV